MRERMILGMSIRPVRMDPGSSKREAVWLAGCGALAAAQPGDLLVTQCSSITLKCIWHSSHRLWTPFQVSISSANGGWWEDQCIWAASIYSKLQNILWQKKKQNYLTQVHLLLRDTGSVCVPSNRRLNSPYYWKYFLSKGFQHFRIWKDQ